MARTCSALGEGHVHLADAALIVPAGVHPDTEGLGAIPAQDQDQDQVRHGPAHAPLPVPCLLTQDQSIVLVA